MEYKQILFTVFPSRRVARQFFLVSPDSEVDEAFADLIIFQKKKFVSQNRDKKKKNKKKIFLQ